jgi:hypothetical protein
MSVPEPPQHPNEFEHKESLPKFLALFLFYGILGGTLGQLIDRGISKLQGELEGWRYAALFYALQILLNGFVFFTLFKTVHFNFPSLRRGGGKMTFDDWMSSTFQGLIFATTMYQVQDQISVNFKRII